MKNTNCLAGIRCPKCGQDESFLISVEATARLTDNGIEIVSCEHDWHDDSRMMCENADCEFTGVVRDFRIGPCIITPGMSDEAQNDCTLHEHEATA